jgi:hypothetical protein
MERRGTWNGRKKAGEKVDIQVGCCIGADVREVLILLLAAALIWQLVERHKMSTELASLRSSVSDAGLEVSDGKIQNAPSPKRSWLESHIERSSHSLDNPANKVRRRVGN